MVIEYCTKHLGSDLLPCKEQLALQSVADYYRIETTDCAAGISVRREAFDQLLEDLRANSVSFEVEPDTAWEAFRGWRINYDEAISGLRDLVHDASSHWERRPSE